VASAGQARYKFQRPQLKLRLMGARQTHLLDKTEMVTMTLRVQLSYRQMQSLLLLLMLILA
jgi:hypothetical protein